MLADKGDGLVIQKKEAAKKDLSLIRLECSNHA